MEDELLEILDDLNIRDTKILLDNDINLSVDSSTRRCIEKSIMKKTGYYNKNNTVKNKINNILGDILIRRNIALALSFGIILSLAGGGYAYARTPVAYVSMDINPSVELGVNTFEKVVSVEAYNEDGEKILEGVNLINYDIDNAVSTIVSNAISEGYISEDGLAAIEITTSTDKDNLATELDESLKNVVDETLNDNNLEAEVETEKLTLARRDEARQLGMTPGKLNLIQKLQELDPTINVEDYKSSSVKDIQKKTKELIKNNKSDEVNTDVVTDENTEDVNLSERSVDSEENTIIEEKINNSLNNKENNSNTKKEENSNVSEEKKNATETIEKQNNGIDVKLEKTDNSSKSENSSNSDSKDNNYNSNYSKSENNNSKSQNKAKNKNEDN